MANNRTSKIVLQWQVQNEKAVAESFDRVYGPLTKTQTAVEELRGSLAGLRTSDAARKLGEEFGVLAGDIKNAANAERQLAESLEKIGASKSDIAAAASEFERFRAAQSELPNFNKSELGGAGGGSKLNLSRIGSELRLLPSTPIPGAGGFTSDQAASVIRVAGAVQQLTRNTDDLKSKVLDAAKAIGLGNIGAVASIAALALVIKALQASTEAARAAAQKGIDARNNAIKLLVEGDQKEIQSRINVLAIEKEVREAQQRDAVQQLADFRSRIREQYGAFQATIGEIDALLGTNNAELIASKAAVDEANKALQQNSVEFDLLTGLTHLSAQSAEELAKAEASLALRRQTAAQDIVNIENTLSAAKEAQQFIDNGTAESLEKRKQAIYDELLLIQQAQQSAADLFKANAGDPEKQAQYRDEVKKLTAQFDTLSATYDALSTSLVENAVAANDLEAQNKELAARTKQLNDDRLKEDEANAEARAKIQQNLNDNLLKAAETLADSSEKALENLRQKAEDLRTSLDRGELVAGQKAQQKALEDQIAIQEKSAAAARSHQRDLLKIQTDAQEREIGLIQSRDFAGLFNSRRQTTVAIQNANRDFLEQQGETARQNALKADENARQLEFERQQRLQSFRFANDDAQKAYDRQIAQANAANVKAIEQARNAANQELSLQLQKHIAAENLLKNAAATELGIIASGAAARLELEAATQQALVQQANQILASVNRGSLLGSGSPGFGTGSTGIGIQGLGAITNNSSSRNNTVNASFSIRSNNPETTAQIVNKTLRSYLVD